MKGTEFYKIYSLTSHEQILQDTITAHSTQASDILIINKKFWKELICLFSSHYLKMSFALKPAFAPT
jgi:hypothetical protein